MELVRIDGSYGEGGGQIIRSAVTLSSLTQKPVEIFNIRKNRKVSGLRAQHLTGIKILAKICNAKVEGLHIGSTMVRFYPSKIQDMQLKEDVGTAGSISLILQVLIPAVSISKKRLKISITGGTDVLWSPTIDYTRFVLKDAYKRLGIDFSVEVQRRGYYPHGGGIVYVEIFPSENINPVSLLKRTTKQANLFCSYSKIPKELVTKDIEEVKTVLENNGFKLDSQIKEEPAYDKGSSLLICSNDESSVIGYDVISSDGKIEDVTVSRFLETNLGVDDYLSDMLVIPMCLANGTSVFRVNSITKHLQTNLFVTTEMLDCKYGIGKVGNGFEVRIEGRSDACV